MSGSSSPYELPQDSASSLCNKLTFVFTNTTCSVLLEFEDFCCATFPLGSSLVLLSVPRIDWSGLRRPSVWRLNVLLLIALVSFHSPVTLPFYRHHLAALHSRDRLLHPVELFVTLLCCINKSPSINIYFLLAAVWSFFFFALLLITF